MKTRKEITQEARTIIADCVSQRDAIRAGLKIASCRCLRGRDSDVTGCLRAATDVADGLRMETGDCRIEDVLAELVRASKWGVLWAVARHEVYPQSC